MKAGYDARVRMKAERDAEKNRAEAERKADEEARARNPEQWKQDMRQRHVVSHVLDAVCKGQKLMSETALGCVATDEGPQEAQSSSDGSQVPGCTEPHEDHRTHGKRAEWAPKEAKEDGRRYVWCQ